MKNTWKFYKDKKGEWRWTCYSEHNGEKIGASSEGYKNRVDCVANAELFGYVEK